MNSNTLSVYRCENKYYLNQVDASNLVKKFDMILARDSFSKESSYCVRSLYFDSINNIDYSTKIAGTEFRKKIRIRTYDPKATRCKLELKEKIGDLQHKVSLWITKEEAIEMVNGHFWFLINHFESSKEAIRLYKELSLGCYRPQVMVEYDRIAFMSPLFNTRITFDMNIRYSESNFNLFDENIIYNKLSNEQIILEVKYNEKLLNYISKVLKPYNLTRVSVSKYCLSRRLYTYFNY